MRKTKVYGSLFIMLFVLALCLVSTGAADADESRTPVRFVWSVDDEEGEPIKADWGTITYTDEGLLIDNTQKNLSWTYSFKVPKTKTPPISWTASVQVRRATGAALPGLSFQNNRVGFGFQINKNCSLGSLSLLSVGESVDSIELFDLPKFDYPCTLTMSYEARTHELGIFINGNVVKAVTLPYYGIPALAGFQELAIMTSNPLHTSLGSVLYGDLTLDLK